MELIRALGALSERAAPEHARLASLLGLPDPPHPSIQEQVFGFQAYPLASVYLNPDGMLGGVARDRVAGFWRAIEVEAPNEPDHLAALFGLYAELRDRERLESEVGRREAYGQAAGALLHEHITSWVWPFLIAVSEAGSSFHQEWAALVGRVLAGELARYDPLRGLPVHLSDAPGLPDPREEGGAPFLSALLAPVRTGLVVTRSTLSRLSTDRRLGLRVGERRFVVEHFLAQDPASALEWLATEAERWTTCYPALAAPERVGHFWIERARATASLLGELATIEEAPDA